MLNKRENSVIFIIVSRSRKKERTAVT